MKSLFALCEKATTPPTDAAVQQCQMDLQVFLVDSGNNDIAGMAFGASCENKAMDVD